MEGEINYTSRMNIQPYYDHTDQLFETYKELNLKSIDDFHGENNKRWDGKNFMHWFSDITRGVQRENEFIESDFKIYDDFVHLSGDIKFCTGMLEYLYPSTTKAHDEFGSTIIDRRYNMHASFGFQSIYHFWDRIGDLLWHFFKTGLKQDSVYTGRVLSNLPQQFKSTDHFINLKQLFDNFTDRFEIRHEVVHNYTLGTKLSWERNNAYRDYQANENLLAKVSNYRSELSDSLIQCIDALEFSLRLINFKNSI